MSAKATRSCSVRHQLRLVFAISSGPSLATPRYTSTNTASRAMICTLPSFTLPRSCSLSYVPPLVGLADKERSADATLNTKAQRAYPLFYDANWILSSRKSRWYSLCPSSIREGEKDQLTKASFVPVSITRGLTQRGRSVGVMFIRHLCSS